MALDIAKVMAYLHSNNVTHRDLKPQNLLVFHVAFARNLLLLTRLRFVKVDESYTKVKLADFGEANNALTEMRSMRGTWYYMAPEQFGIQTKEKPYTNKVDVFSFG